MCVRQLPTPAARGAAAGMPEDVSVPPCPHPSTRCANSGRKIMRTLCGVPHPAPANPMGV